MSHSRAVAAHDLPLLIMISTGPQRYREYLFESIRTQYRIHLINTVAPTWELDHIAGATVIPTTDVDLVLAAAREVAAKHRVAGVMSWDEARIHQAAVVAAEFGLPTTDPDAVWRCRDKYAGRSALATAGVAQPAHLLVGTAEQARGAAAEIGYPVVLKPRAAAASYGVVLVHTVEELDRYFSFAATATVPHAPRYDLGVLVEEYLEAPEVSIDSAVRGGAVVPLFVGWKDVGYPPYFEEVGHTVSHRDALLGDQAMLDVLQKTHAALGFTDGWTHAEFKLTSSGPTVIEVNGRLGGDLIPYLGMRASGIDPGLIAAAVACGREPQITVERDLVAAVRFFYADHADTVIDSVTFDESALPPAIDAAVALVERGAVVSPPPEGLVSGRIAFATAVGASAQSCQMTLDQAQTALRVIEMLPAETR